MKSLPANEIKNDCKGIVYKCRESTYFSSWGTIEQRKSLSKLKRKSCPGCDKCFWLDEFIQEEINSGNLKIDNCENRKLYRLKVHTSQGYYDLYPEVDYSEFVEEKQ